MAPVRGQLVRAGGREVKISRPQKVLFPDDGITKQDLIDYYRRIASWILPHLRGRLLALERYPDGIDKPGFFQKTTPLYYPGWIKTVTISKKTGGSVRHVVCDDAATLVYLANQACITPHIWLSRTDKLDYPDQLVFDPHGERQRVLESKQWIPGGDRVGRWCSGKLEPVCGKLLAERVQSRNGRVTRRTRRSILPRERRDRDGIRCGADGHE